MSGLLAALEQLTPVVALRNSVIAYPLINAAHVIGVALLFGAIVPLDLRLGGWRRRTASVDTLAGLLLPVAVAGLVLAAAAGIVLFATDARAYAASTLFQAKMLLIAAAIANALALRRVDWRSERPGGWVRLAAVASVVLWLGAIVLGRLVGYF